MEKVIKKIVEKCVQEDLIEENQKDWLIYLLQRKLVNTGGFFILICFGALVASLTQVVLLNFGLAFLRKKTNGLHMPTKFSCFIVSLFCEYVCLFLVNKFQYMEQSVLAILFIVSLTLILILAPYNNSAIHCSSEELLTMKISVYKRLALCCLVIPAFFTLKPSYGVVWIVSVIADAFLLVLAKMGLGIQ